MKLGAIMDYEFNIATWREEVIADGETYYRNAPTDEILHFASVWNEDRN